MGYRDMSIPEKLRALATAVENDQSGVRLRETEAAHDHALIQLDEVKRKVQRLEAENAQAQATLRDTGKQLDRVITQLGEAEQNACFLQRTLDERTAQVKNLEDAHRSKEQYQSWYYTQQERADAAVKKCEMLEADNKNLRDDGGSVFVSGVRVTRHPMQPIEYDESGVIRFKGNAIVRAIVDDAVSLTATHACHAPGLDLNKIIMRYHSGMYSREDVEQFWQLMGYSISGYGGLSFIRPSVVAAADEAAEALRNNKNARKKRVKKEKP